MKIANRLFTAVLVLFALYVVSQWGSPQTTPTVAAAPTPPPPPTPEEIAPEKQAVRDRALLLSDGRTCARAAEPLAASNKGLITDDELRLALRDIYERHAGSALVRLRLEDVIAALTRGRSSDVTATWGRLGATCRDISARANAARNAAQ